MPFDPSIDDDDAWWPNPWPPRRGPGGGAPYPNDWTDPFINSRAAGPNPVASVPAPFSAASLGAMAWHPPIFPGDWSTFVPNNFSAATWPPQPISPAAPTPSPDLANAPGWPFPQSILAPLAQLASPTAPRSIDQPRGLFSRDPSLPVGGLFGWDPDPSSPFAGGPFGAGGRTAATATLGMPDVSSAPGWPASPLPPLAKLAAPPSINSPSGLFSRDPSIPVGGLFGWDPDPMSPFAGGPFGAGGRAAAAPMPGAPAALPALGWPAPQSLLPPPAQLQSPFAAGGPPPDPSNSLPASPPDGSVDAAPPTRSVLFNHSPAAWDPGARERDLVNLDQAAQSLGVSELPISKSGAPYVPPPPQLSITPQIEPVQWLDVARWLSPNLVDYFTKTLPPSPPFPSTPGKIPSTDNPYAPGAAFEAATWLLSGLEGAIVGPLESAAGAVERSAAEAAIKRGSFSITDWSGYPAYVSRPKGPFRLIEGQEYEESRDAADRINENLHKVDPGTYEGKHIHEIHPIKFGGSPTDLTNKIALSPQDHYDVNAWWRRLQRNMQTGRVTPGKDK